MVTLSIASLGALPATVEVPTYSARNVTASIVHFGVGAFHRAHQAMYIDRVLNNGSTEWGICGVGILPSDSAMRDALLAQDNLYTLVTKAPDGGSEARVIGSIVEYIYAPDDPQAVLDKLTSAATRIVSLTVTEGGYGMNDAAGVFEPSDDATRADLAENAVPRSVLGFIVAALASRYESGQQPFTVMSCDNIQGNGRFARSAVLGFAERKSPRLAAWIAEKVAFPNAMVDRITPATTDETRATLARDYDIDDLWPVGSESFEQWVLEDRFTMGRPPLENVGVQMVQDVEPYERMKLRLLNASHQAMGYLGILSGAIYVHEVCNDRLFVEFLLGYMHEEAIPTLLPVPGIDLEDYCLQLIARFGSEAIRDTLARQVVDASDRIPKFVVPVIEDQLRNGRGIARSVLVLSAWSVFLEGSTESGEPTPIVDRQLEGLRLAIAEEEREPGRFLDFAPVFGQLGADPRLREAFIGMREALRRDGVRSVVRNLNRRVR